MSTHSPKTLLDHKEAPGAATPRAETNKELHPVIETQNTPPDQQLRERAVPCRACGLRPGRRGLEPCTMTWNPSGLCERHEALRAVLE